MVLPQTGGRERVMEGGNAAGEPHKPTKLVGILED
jgi:hypothetical protein